MDVIINEVTASVRMVDSHALLDERTLRAIVQAVTAAIDDRDARARRREEEVRIADDGRGGLAGLGGAIR
jgi:hypothetical protein